MVITILDEQLNEVIIIPAYFTGAEALNAAKDAVREAAAEGKAFTAIDEDGNNILPPSFCAPVANLNVKFESYDRDVLGDDLATFSGVFVF